MKVIRRRAESLEVDSDGTWAISYGDTVTLLLTFFILFFSMTPEQDRIKQIKMSLVETLKQNSQIFVQGNQATKNTLNLGTKNEKGIDLEALKKMNGVVNKDTVGQRILVDFPEISFFDTASTSINSEGAQALQNFAKQYLSYSGQLLLKVHAFTDERKVKAKHYNRFKDNLELSALRSVAAMRVLQNSGIPLDRIRVGGFGELRMTQEEINKIKIKAKGKDKAQWKLARKIVLVIEPEGEGK